MVRAGGMPERQSALGDLLAVRWIGPAAARPGVILAERPDRTIWQVSAWREADVALLRGTVAELMGVALPEGTTCASAADVVIFHVAPRRWWLVFPEDRSRDLSARLAASVIGRAALTDHSHGRTVVRLGGPASPNVLQKLCRVDLRPLARPGGHVIQTTLGQVAALIHALEDEPSFDLYLPRSLAHSAVEGLIDAAIEFVVAIGDQAP